MNGYINRLASIFERYLINSKLVDSLKLCLRFSNKSFEYFEEIPEILA